MPNLLARIHPAPVGFAEPELFQRSPAPAGSTGVRLAEGDMVSFDTSFGAFAAGRWRRLTGIDEVVARIGSDGHVRAELVAVEAGTETVVDAAERAGAGCAELRYRGLQESTIDSLYVRITAMVGGATVGEGSWSTTASPRRQVRLGVAITTFNRQEYVRATVRQLVAMERDLADLRGNLQVVVVDNASNLDRETDFGLDPQDPVTLVPSPNLGGAGGFARGLIHLRNEGWATHVVLMDDDISLGPDAIVRTVALLRHAYSDDLCVHGAMLSEERRWMQFEAGSHYSFRSVYPLRAVGRFQDLRSRDVALADEPEVSFDYTAWWFTVFPVHLAVQNPLPVFVRGDDVAYGLMHTGEHTVTLDGVVVWHADFALKNNPSSLYYEVRNFALIDTLVFDDHRWWNLAWRFMTFGFRNLYSHRYASCEYSIAGMRQFLEGPEKWGDIDHAALHDRLRQVTEEKAGPLPPDLAAMPLNKVHSKPVRLVGFVLALLLRGGSLIPRRLRSSSPGVVPIDVRAVGVALRHDTIVYRHPRIDEGYLCHRDRERFRRLEREVFAVTWRLFRTYKSLRTRYRDAYPRMVSDESWEKLFSRSGA